MMGAPASQEKLFAGCGLESGAIFSPCRRWRYVLWRIRDPTLPLLVSYGLNPSKADELRSDNTCSKMLKFATLWGFGGLIKLNAYSWCATKPAEMKRRGIEAIGDLNDYWIEAVEREFGPKGRNVIAMRIAGWGQHDFLKRGELIKRYIPNLYHFGTNKDGSPTHPLFIPFTAKPIPLN